MIEKPYLLFLGDVADQLAAKTACGIADWRPDWCVGQLRLDGCQADTGQEDIDIDEALSRGARTMVVGVVNQGGFLPEHWTASIVEAIEKGMDIASGLHARLEDFPAVGEAARKHGRKLHNIRHSTQKFGTGKGLKRTGKRVLTVGTDCSVGKKYSALAIEREMHRRGLKADFRATGQTGVLIAERGIAIDAVISDFIAGAAEWLTPDNDADHWDVVEGQGSLFHAAYAGVSLGLLHGAQADALVLCHEPTRKHMRGLPHYPLPDLQECIERNEICGRLTNPACRVVAVSVDTHNLAPAEAERFLRETEDRLGLPAADPIAGDIGRIVDAIVG